MFSAGLAGAGHQAMLYDTAIEFFHYISQASATPNGDADTLVQHRRRALRAIQYFQKTPHYDPMKHRTQINNLHQYLSRWSAQFPGWRLGVTDVSFNAIPPHDPEKFIDYVQRGGVTPFSAYIHQVALPTIKALAPAVVGISVTYLSQIYAAIELGLALREAAFTPVLGGALINILDQKADEPFSFHGIFSRQHPALDDFQRSQIPSQLKWPQLIVPLERYFTPIPIIPFPLTRGCYWNRCLFCPDSRQPFSRYDLRSIIKFLTCALESISNEKVIFNICDSAIPPSSLRQLLPFLQETSSAFYGFLRFENALLKDNFLESVRTGGGQLLQFGLESGSQQILNTYQKGIRLAQAREILSVAHDCGIKNYVYLLFGLPTEKAIDRLRTVNFIRENHRNIDFLNVSLFNLPTDCSLLRDPKKFDIILTEESQYQKPLQLYAPFTGKQGFRRNEARQFIQNHLQRDLIIRPILLNTPARLRIDHAIFF